MIRFFDILFSFLGLIVLSPVIILVVIVIGIEGRGKVIFKQERIGHYGVPFNILKFRTMRPGVQSNVLITMQKDSRITQSGRIIRRFKIDEIPQLVNVIKGEMSIVGPRPEVRKYVEQYTPEQRRILSIRPGITDLASIAYYDEGRILDRQESPEEYYQKVLIPEKLELSFTYLENQNIGTYFSILIKTIIRIFHA